METSQVRVSMKARGHVMKALQEVIKLDCKCDTSHGKSCQKHYIMRTLEGLHKLLREETLR